MSVLFTFPGQGAQLPGMLHRLPAHPEVTRSLKEAKAVLGIDPLTLDSARAQQSTIAVQLCLLIAGVAMARVLNAQGAQPDMVAGLSIGAYPAAVIAAVLDFSDALFLVRRRGQLMENAFPTGHGMAAVIGLDRDQVQALIDEVHSPTCPAYLANVNAERQMVIAGADAAMQTLMKLALERGATRAEKLEVSIPAHTPLFEPAAEAMRGAFSNVAVRRPRLIWLSSSVARAIFNPAQIAEDLASNMARQVQWHDTAQLAWERGARLAVEMPSGSVLTKLIQPVFAEGTAVSCEDTRVETVVSLVRRLSRDE